MNYCTSTFYCTNCGREGVPIARRKSSLRKQGHMKILYCPWCKETVNAVELSSPEEIEQFKKDFEEGKYQEYATEKVKEENKRRWGIYL